MSITINESAVVDTGATAIALSSLISVTASASNPAYLVLTGLDRNEYTAGASEATGSFLGNGAKLNFSNTGGDARSAGIVFTYQAATGRYYSSTYGFLDQLTYDSSGSLDDLTSLSLFGASNQSLANAFASSPYNMINVDASGFIGGIDIATEPKFTGTVPAQATPDSIAAVADSFVGQAWNMNGCWVLANTIAAEAGAALPVTSSMIGEPGLANGEWIVAFNGPAGQTGNWESMVTTGDVVVIGGPNEGHVTTCVSGTGASAMLVDNVTEVNQSGAIMNSANDGSASDVIVAAPHAATAEWGGVSTADVVIYELDCPIVADAVTTDTLAASTQMSLSALFTATDPAGKSITEWQVYDTSASDELVVNGADAADHAAANAATVSSLSSVALLAGSSAASDTIEVRAFNGSYWGDWQSMAVAVSAPAAAAAPPTVANQTAGQTWLAGKTISLALPAATFKDPQNETLTYKATLANGAALPSWLTFNAKTDAFTGTAPATAQTLSLDVTATDTSGLSVSETFSATVIGAPVVAIQTANQTWLAGASVSLGVPASAFKDPQGEALTETATLANGAALPSWLSFNATTGAFGGTAPAGAQTLSLAVTAKDSSGLSVSDDFTATVIGAPVLASATAGQVWSAGKAFTLTLPTTTFKDPQNEALTYGARLANGQALPSWLTFNAATETFSGTAPAATASLAIAVTATDTSGLSASETIAVVVGAAPLVAAATSAQSWVAGTAMTLALVAGTFTDPQGSALTYSATLSSGAALPSWLHFNAATDTFSGTGPAAAAPIQIDVKATDALGLSANDVFALTVLGPPKLMSQTATQDWVEGKAISLTLPPQAFVDGQGQALTYTATLANGAALPAWLKFNATTHAFSGTAPTTAQALDLTVKATDTSGLSATDTFVANLMPEIGVSAPTANQTWIDGQKVDFVVPASAFTDAAGEKMSFVAMQTSGTSAASWLSFNPSTGALIGAVPSTASGTIGMEIEATDASGAMAADMFSITLAPAAGHATTAATGGSIVAGGAISSLILIPTTHMTGLVGNS